MTDAGGDSHDVVVIVPSDAAAEHALIARLKQRITVAPLDQDVGRASPLPSPASAAAVRATEAACGIALPRLLTQLYREIANGGFGPAYGLLGVEGGHRDDGRRTVWRWRARRPAALLAICHWGCGIYSLVDASAPDARMWGYDPNPGPTGDDALFPQEYGLAQWLARWLDGALHQPWLVEDPLTGRWRGATDDEFVAALSVDP